MGLLISKMLGGPKIEYVPEPPTDWAALWPQTEEVDGSRLVRLLPKTPLFDWKELEQDGCGTDGHAIQHDQARTRVEEKGGGPSVALYDWRVSGSR